MSNRRRKATAFLERTDPLVVSAMRKTSGQSYQLTIEEQAALDTWLEPRLAALVDALMEQMGHPTATAAIGPSGRGVAL